jgi:hypothetical protein
MYKCVNFKGSRAVETRKGRLVRTAVGGTHMGNPFF